MRHRRRTRLVRSGRQLCWIWGYIPLLEFFLPIIFLYYNVDGLVLLLYYNNHWSWLRPVTHHGHRSDACDHTQTSKDSSNEDFNGYPRVSLFGQDYDKWRRTGCASVCDSE